LPITGDGAGRHIRPAIQLPPVLMRPAVRFVTRSPVAPNNPMPLPLPQIEALMLDTIRHSIYNQPPTDWSRSPTSA
jgi:hypothetical protein